MRRSGRSRGSETVPLHARSLARLNCAGLRDDASMRGWGAMTAALKRCATQNQDRARGTMAARPSNTSERLRQRLSSV